MGAAAGIIIGLLSFEGPLATVSGVDNAAMAGDATSAPTAVEGRLVYEPPLEENVRAYGGGPPL